MTRLYVRTREAGEGQWATIAVVTHGRHEVAQAVEELFERSTPGWGATTTTGQELFDREGSEGVERAEREADTPEARQLVQDAEALVRDRDSAAS